MRLTGLREAASRVWWMYDCLYKPLHDIHHKFIQRESRSSAALLMHVFLYRLFSAQRYAIAVRKVFLNVTAAYFQFRSYVT